MKSARLLLLACLFCLLALRHSVAEDNKGKRRGNRDRSAIPDEIYDALIRIIDGESLPAVKERTRAQRSAAVRYWRAQGDLTIRENDGCRFIYSRASGRQLLRISEVRKVVSHEYERVKGSGAAKLVSSLKQNFAGLSRAKVQEILNTDKQHYKRNTKFCNKGRLKPIRAREVQTRHQIDLMDMGQKGAVRLNGVSYRYVLSVMDVFSRFIWLRPVSKKNSKNIADALRLIYLEHGPPRVVQCDQGGEFKGAVIEICRRLQIKIICSRPYHPQSQGKVERSHRALRSKIEYDFIRMGAKGVNWVRSLPDYQRILNEDPKEVLAYKTPFEVYFARRFNSCNTTMADEEVVANVGHCDPSEGDRRRRSKRASKIRKQASKASNRCSERMVKGHLRSHPPSKYNVGEKVYVRLPRKGGIKDAQKKRYVIEAVIVKRNINRHAYKVAYASPIIGHKEEKWLPVDDITSLTLGEEKRKQRAARLSKKRTRAHYNKYYVPMEPDDYNKIIEDQGFQIDYNPPGDGSCQFAALAHQLSAFGIFRSPQTMRDEIVKYLDNNAVDEMGFPLQEFVPEFTSWTDYLEYMARCNTFGDQITLFAAANLYSININVISTLGPSAQHVFAPSLSPLGTVYLGHFAQGEHYVSLTPWWLDGQNDAPDDVVESDGSMDGSPGSDRDADGEGGNDGDADGDGGSDGNDDGAGGNDRDADGDGGSDGNEDGTGGNDGDADNELRSGLGSGYSQQYLDNDVLESIIRFTVQSFPFMRTSLRAVNTFFRATVDKVPYPRVYIPKLGGKTIIISIRKVLMLRGKGSSAAERLREVINSPRWYHAWVRLVPLSYGWFMISGIYWRNSRKFRA